MPKTPSAAAILAKTAQSFSVRETPRPACPHKQPGGFFWPRWRDIPAVLRAEWKDRQLEREASEEARQIKAAARFVYDQNRARREQRREITAAVLTLRKKAGA